MALRVPTYQSNANINALPSVNLSTNYNIEAFGGGANKMPQAIDNFARAAQRLNLQLYNNHMEERQEVLAAELMNNNIDYSTSYQQKLAELEQNYQGMDAKGVVEELDSFHTQQEAALTEKYANNPKAQRAAMLHASRLRADSGAWSVKHVRKQEQVILEDADNKQNALLINSFPNMNPEQAEHFIDMRAASMANTIYKGRPDAVKLAKEKLKVTYMEQLAENKPGEFLSLYTSTGNMKENLPQGEIGEWLQQAAEKEGLPVELLTKVGRTESNFDPEAVSSAGARGIFQFMPNTAKEMGITNPHDPKQSIFGGAKYLAQLNKKYNGDQKLTLMAYNWGPGNVDAWLKTGKGTKGQAVPQETTNYLTKILNNSADLPASASSLIPKAQARLKEQEQQQRSAAVISTADALWTQLKGLPVEQQEAEGHKLIADIEDRELAINVGKAFDLGISERKKAQDANDWTVKQELLEATKAKTVTEQLQAVQEAPLSPKAKHELEKEIMGEGRVETLLNTKAKRELMVAIGKGEIKDSETLYAEAQRSGLTREQAEACQSYLEKGGINGEIKYEAVNRAVQQLGVLTGDKRMKKQGIAFKPELFDCVVTSWPPDLPVTEDNLRREISRWIIEERIEPGWIFDSTYTKLEAAKEGKLSEYRDEWEESPNNKTNVYGRAF